MVWLFIQNNGTKVAIILKLSKTLCCLLNNIQLAQTEIKSKKHIIITSKPPFKWIGDGL